MSVPVSLLGVEYPDDVHSVREWLTVFRAMNIRIREPKDVDVIVQELGTDKPGEIAHFGTYLQPDIAVVTAISDEHIDIFWFTDTYVHGSKYCQPLADRVDVVRILYS
jgi:hypothetical protein